MSVLHDILANKRREVDALRECKRTLSSRVPLDTVAALRRAGGQPLRLVAEVKLRSPSAGMLSRELSPGDRALAYAREGVAMVSVLCDDRYFGGSWAHLAAARERLDREGTLVPLLAKEFVLDARQIAEARDRGADAVLLIARIVDTRQLSDLACAARTEGIEPLFEVFEERELDAALCAGARIVGVNARDLDTLTVDGARAANLLSSIPPEVVAVHLSGLRHAEDIAQVARGRADAALVGEALMRDDDPRPRLRSMLAAARKS